jgi:hypothetical protein
MERELHVVLRTKLILRVAEGVDVREILDNVSISFSDSTQRARIMEASVLDFNIPFSFVVRPQDPVRSQG